MAKGADFERLVCKQLSLWWTDDERDDVFWRSQTSGGRATMRRRRGRSTFGQYGDVAATDPIGQPLLQVVTIELKCGYAKHSVADVFDRPDHLLPQQFEQFLSQVITDAHAAGTPFWMLITKRTGRTPLVWFPKKLANIFEGWGCFVPIPKLQIEFTADLRLTKNNKFKRHQIFGTGLVSFFESIAPSDFQLLAEEY